MACFERHAVAIIRGQHFDPGPDGRASDDNHGCCQKEREGVQTPPSDHLLAYRSQRIHLPNHHSVPRLFETIPIAERHDLQFVLTDMLCHGSVKFDA